MSHAEQYLNNSEFSGDLGDLIVVTLANILRSPITNVSHAAYYVFADLRRFVLVMKTTLMANLSFGPYKESVKIVQIQMPFHGVGNAYCNVLRKF